ncbi:hypothetical protein OSB04_000047 [Centaurea solstitialis]|uniref:Reverse transcriptase zinc-binding domain-containing protein n=1 Tax=Centaurea solstitialis TaxID=347529 RepID=A0AA38WUB6_9ASTR|nr:hypothetical protein OSB04_000047 [Centaurea solstitialis]
MRCFYLSSGLKINLNKSSLMGVCVDSSEIEFFSNKFHCKAGSLPFTYLGLPIGCSMNRCESWEPVLNKFLSKLSNWKASNLSSGGRLVLISVTLKCLVTLDAQSLPGETSDKVAWALERSGQFTVASMRKAYDDFYLKKSSRSNLMWTNRVPSKVSIHAWRTGHCRLPTKCNLQKRGINLLSLDCSLCGGEEETEDHLFVRCPVARSVLNDIGRWWGVNASSVNHLRDLFQWGQVLNFKGDTLKAFLAVIYTYLWLLWKMRNGKIFSSSDRGKDLFVNSQVQAYSFFWIKTRSRCSLANRWLQWCCSPSSCF